MKWILIIVVAVIGFMVVSGNMGGARDATQNYVDVRAKGGGVSKETEARPNLMHQMIEYNKNK
jgi:hypothetical protein